VHLFGLVQAEQTDRFVSGRVQSTTAAHNSMIKEAARQECPSVSGSSRVRERSIWLDRNENPKRDIVKRARRELLRAGRTHDIALVALVVAACSHCCGRSALCGASFSHLSPESGLGVAPFSSLPPPPPVVEWCQSTGTNHQAATQTLPLLQHRLIMNLRRDRSFVFERVCVSA
jgi:hypothetical protein